MPQHQKIIIRYAISFWIGNKKPYLHRMIVLNRWLQHLLIILTKKWIDSKQPWNKTDQVPDNVSLFCGVYFEQFNVVSEVDIRKIISSTPTKSCALDPIPTWLQTQCQNQLAPVLTTIVNASLSCAEFLTVLKKAFLTPLIDKIILDCDFLRTTGLCLIYLSFQSLWNTLFVFN